MDKNLTLVITPETWAERYALEKWSELYFGRVFVNLKDYYDPADDHRGYLLVNFGEFRDEQK